MTLSEAIAAAVSKCGFENFNTELKLADPRFGDLQLNGALAYAKANGRNPREVATEIVDALEINKDELKVEIAGPGFINFTYTPTALADALKGFDAPEKFSPMTRNGQKIVLDYGSPNIGKQLHIGHLRTYNIGEAINRLLRFCGANVHRDNHIGDWGTMFGYIIYAIKKTGTQLDENDPGSLKIIDELYKMANAEAKDDEAVTQAARDEVAKLQNGDEENTALWKKIVAANMASLLKFQESFGISYDSVHGESFYQDKVQRVYDELTQLGIAKEDQGALVVFHPEHKRFKEQPFIIRKSDGAANYASSDLAGMTYRVEELGADEIYVVTDTRQADHFEQLWLTTKKWFEAKGYRLPKFDHVSHGAILGADNKPLKTRSGETVKLNDILDEAKQRAFDIVTEKNPDMSEEQRREIAEVVGIDSVRYADLCQNRSSDYQFDWDKLLAFEGNTAPYQLYAIARIYSIFDKAGTTPEAVASANFSDFTTDTEIALARKLIQAPTHIALAAADLRPHFLCTYLYELTGVFSSFYNADRIMGEADDVVARRLFLAAKTLMVLETGLDLLGLKTLKKM